MKNTFLVSTEEEMIDLGKKIGFKYIVAGPLIRSSYKAHEFFSKATLLEG